MLKKLLIAGLVLVVLGLAAAGAGYWLAFSPNTATYEGARGVKVPRGASFAQVLDSLEAGGIIASRQTLGWVGRGTGWGGQVKAGYYRFESGASNYEILDTIRKGLQSPVKVTIPPGTRPEVVAAVAAREMAFSADAFRAALRDTALARELGTDTTHLFGYLLPETYQFYWLAPPENVIRKAKEGFDALYAAHADSQSVGPEEALRLASIVEWETGLPEEKPRVAGVYLNRLRDGWPLQADPTVQYAVMEEEGQKRRLLFEDYDLAHPYNTYAYRGLPPGPLTNPSPSSVRAVLQPEAHGYFFFVATGDGGHVFSRTLREHNRAADRYYERMRERRRAAQQSGSGDN